MSSVTFHSSFFARKTLRQWIVFLAPLLFTSGGIALRLAWMNQSILGLDERYSLYFSTFPLTQLLFQFQSDTHTGYFYALLRVLKPTHWNIISLRVFFNLVPLILGSGIFWIWNQYRQQPLRAGLGLFFLWFHPLLFSLTWSVRFYGWVTFCGVLWYVVFSEYLRKPRSSSLVALFAITLIGTTFHLFFPLLWLGAVFLSLFQLAPKIALRPIITSIFGLVGWVFFLKGFPTTSSLSGFSWVLPPSLERLTSLLFVFSGSISYEWSNHTLIPTGAVLFFSTVILCSLLRFRPVKNSPVLARAAVFIIGSILFFFFLSQAMLFLSHRRYIHTFIPQLSLFHPRVIFPFFLVAMFFLIEYVSEQLSHSGRKLTILLCSLIGAVWISHISFLTFTLLSPSHEQKVQTQELNHVSANATTTTLYWPAWTLFWTITQNEPTEPRYIQQQFNRSAALELHWHDKHDPQYVCRTLANQTLIINTLIHTNEKDDKKKLLEVLNQCCAHASGEFIQSWSCQEAQYP